ncbi:MAG: NifU N-terminal domain-containing protein [Anaerolineae bacterium]|nr:NifU N-terminal domain-containing protein [Anaerolineae bacterium]
MSEYITVNAEPIDDADHIRLITNLNLAPDGPESYANREAGDEGSPLAQTLFGIDGLLALDLEDNVMTIRRDPAQEWPDLIDEITTALKDFFL